MTDFRRPIILQPRTFLPTKPSVVFRQLPQQIAAMRSMKHIQTQPYRHPDGLRTGKRLQLDVVEPFLPPHFQRNIVIKHQCFDIVLPHQNGRMVSPSTAIPECANNLVCFDPLFTATAIVQTPQAFTEIRVGEEGLHG